jgi:hypothetical protein
MYDLFELFNVFQRGLDLDAAISNFANKSKDIEQESL